MTPKARKLFLAMNKAETPAARAALANQLLQALAIVNSMLKLFACFVIGGVQALQFVGQFSCFVGPQPRGLLSPTKRIACGNISATAQLIRRQVVHGPEDTW